MVSKKHLTRIAGSAMAAALLISGEVSVRGIYGYV